MAYAPEPYCEKMVLAFSQKSTIFQQDSVQKLKGIAKNLSYPLLRRGIKKRG